MVGDSAKVLWGLLRHGSLGKNRNLRSSNCWKCIEIVNLTITTLFLYHFKSFTIPSGGPFWLLGGVCAPRAPPCLQACDLSRLSRCDAEIALLKSADVRLPRGPTAKETRRLLLEAIAGWKHCRLPQVLQRGRGYGCFSPSTLKIIKI